MNFNILGVDLTYGNHRHSNNSILSAIYNSSGRNENLLLSWWPERIFSNHQDNETFSSKLMETSWFGFMHIPLLSPTWSRTGQNNISNLYFNAEWRHALRKCKGLIALSKYHANQLKLLYPGINCYHLKHPIIANYSADSVFNFDKFSKQPSMLIAGSWLRDFDSFIDLKIGWKKNILFKNYTKDYLKFMYSKYSDASKKLYLNQANIHLINYLSNEEYDSLLASSLVYLCVHDTSANNALIECLLMSTPFVSVGPHPAMVEYVGNDYPLFLKSHKEIESIDLNIVKSAHEYLKNKKEQYEDDLSIDSFIKGLNKIVSKF